MTTEYRAGLSLPFVALALVLFAPPAAAGGRLYGGTVLTPGSSVPVVLGAAYDSHPHSPVSLLCGVETLVALQGGHVEQFYGGLKLGTRRAQPGGARPYVLGGLGLATILSVQGSASTSYLGAGLDFAHRSGRLVHVELRRVMPLRGLDYGIYVAQIGVGFGR